MHRTGKLLQESADEGPAELAQLRAEVARALRTQPPDLALLHATLERVDALLAKARAELVAIVREVPDTERSDHASF